MHLTLLLPGVLSPREVIGALAAPLARTALATIVQRAEIVGDSETADAPHLAWLAEHLFRRPTPLPTAPYAYAALASAPPTAGSVWHADPVHLELARDHLVVMPLPGPATDDELESLMAAANELAAAAELQFVRVGTGWFLTATRAWDLTAPPLSSVMGAPLQAGMPSGSDAAAWTRLLTEIQMTWHAHAVNEAREARGLPTINSLWVHGGGAWSALPRPAYDAVLSDAPPWRGAAQAASIEAALSNGAPRDRSLIVLDAALAPHALNDWTAWLEAVSILDEVLARHARDNTLDLVLTGRRTTRRLRARPGDRLKFWRTHTVEQVLSE